MCIKYGWVPLPALAAMATRSLLGHQINSCIPQQMYGVAITYGIVWKRVHEYPTKTLSHVDMVYETVGKWSYTLSQQK